MGMMHIDTTAPILHCDEVDSTNTLLARAARGELPTNEAFAPFRVARRPRDARFGLTDKFTGADVTAEYGFPPRRH